jgi:ATP-dependent RNA helicase RhlE
MSFAELELSEPLLRAVRGEGYTVATPIQAEAIPHVLAGRDILGCAQTGTGKTAAFALPVLQRLGLTSAPPHGRRIRALVLAPTRELALQIAESFKALGRHTGLRQAVVFGGVGQNPQVRALQHGMDILVATPGRLLDLINQGFVNLGHVETLILDEADRMLDMGFIHDLKRILSRLPQKRQTLLFSATMPQDIRQLAGQWLRDPVTISIVPQATPAERVEQSVYFVEKQAKPQHLVHYLRKSAAHRTLVFIRTKHGADKLVRSLVKSGIRAEAIHGNKSQNVRQRVLAQFKSQHPPVLVATDIAARGLDIEGVSHVVNFDMPMTAETYVHRIGRTGRAGAEGIALTLCDRDERSMLRDIERLTRQRINVAQSDLPIGEASSGEPATESARGHGAQRPAFGRPSTSFRPSGARGGVGREQRGGSARGGRRSTFRGGFRSAT